MRAIGLAFKLVFACILAPVFFKALHAGAYLAAFLICVVFLVACSSAEE
jgi:hypothetical protein